jgi:hypothetical protein
MYCSCFGCVAKLPGKPIRLVGKRRLMGTGHDWRRLRRRIMTPQPSRQNCLGENCAPMGQSLALTSHSVTTYGRIFGSLTINSANAMLMVSILVRGCQSAVEAAYIFAMEPPNPPFPLAMTFKQIRSFRLGYTLERRRSRIITLCTG